MSKVRHLTQAIRHAPGIENAEWLWNFLRQPYHRFLNLSGKGVSVPVGGSCFVRIPSEFSGAASWELYEPESIKATVDWLKEHPTSLFLDIGCAIGTFSTVALFASDQVEVFAFDSDLSSLKATERMCQYAVGNRLRLIYGFISDKHVSGFVLRTAISQTWEAITASFVTGNPGTNTYVCIHGNMDNTIPTHSLDGLILAESFMNRPILLKCDVEGAELLVLRGAERLLHDFSPQLLISVHPPALLSYGHSVRDVREYLESAGYQIEVLAIDHEEHWWCEKRLTAA